MTTSRGPSPIVTLAWHASSPKQKADMLAAQTYDGDLRVWSVAKTYNKNEPAKVIRILRRSENLTVGANWMGWSKNGRVIQFSEKCVPFCLHRWISTNRSCSETRSWDVRTKHITFDDIPTLEHVHGLAVYGPGATLFTIGPNGFVQQFDLNAPSIMVANKQHPVNQLPPSPPNSIEEPGNGSVSSATTIHTSDSESSSVPFEMGISESDEDHMSPLARIVRRQGAHSGSSGNESYDSLSPVSSRSAVSGNSKHSAGSRTPGRAPASMRSKGHSDHTYISAGTSIHSSVAGHAEPDNYSMGYSFGTTSVSSMASSRGPHRPSKLRHEIPRSPDDNGGKVHDLFKFTRTRLSDIPYTRATAPDNSRLTNDDLRHQMLSTIFGWHNDVEDLIRDEMSRHPAGSANRILLAKWLGDIESDIMEAGSQNMTSADWMMLALSGMGGQSSQHKLGRAFVQRLLEGGDIHVAVTMMLGMGDHNDAIEIYVSHKRYMEALLLTCLTQPEVWERQAAIIRKWGEWAVQHGQQQLAIRCFACTDQESSEPWRSPSAVQLNFNNMAQSIPEILSPPLSPPGLQRGPQRSIAKASALRLITSFGDQNQKTGFYHLNDDGQTPIAAGVTPIAESAVSPGGNDLTTAFIRPSNNSRFNTPTSARPAVRGRLPSIGEIPSDLNRIVSSHANNQQTGRRGHSRNTSSDQDNLAMGNSLPRAATASPMMMRDNHNRVVTGYEGERPPSPDQSILQRMQEAKSNVRNGSRDRIPRGINLQLQPMEQQNLIDTASTEQSGTSSARFHWPTRRRGPSSVASSVTSASSAGRSYRQSSRTKTDLQSRDPTTLYSHPDKDGRPSEERNKETSQDRHTSRDRKNRSRDTSEDRGRGSVRSIPRAKRSPTSPVPMSPEDLASLTPRYFDSIEPGSVRKAPSVASVTKVKSRTSSRGSDTRRRASKTDTRGRSHGRSPTSPVPISAIARHIDGSEDEEDLQLAIQEQEAFRAKHSRSASRGLNSPAASRSGRSDREAYDTSDSFATLQPANLKVRAASSEHAGDLRLMKDDRERKKVLAARELEERRRSLAKRAQTPQTQDFDEQASRMSRVGVEYDEAPLPDNIPPRCATEPPRSMYARPSLGLPATPKAMHLVLESGHPNDFDGLVNEPSVQEQLPREPVYAYAKPNTEVPSGVEDEGGEDDTLLLLPATVYQPPPKRSMSAPPIREKKTKKKAGKKKVKKTSADGDDTEANKVFLPPPPPPPPAPPVLKELQHLAMPPPPPPAPLHGSQGGKLSIAAGIEIVQDEGEYPYAPVVVAPNDYMVPILSPPAPPNRKHGRSRSLSVSGRDTQHFNRPRKDSIEVGIDGHMIQSPILSPPPMHFNQDAIRSPVGNRPSQMF